MLPFFLFDSLHPSQQFFNYVGMGLPGLNQDSVFAVEIRFCLSKLSVLDLGFISIVSLGPRASTKVEFHAIFTKSRKV